MSRYNHRFQYGCVLALSCWFLQVTSATAQSDNSTLLSVPTAELQKITVTATRSTRPVEEVPAAVSVVSLEEIEREQPQSLDDLLQGLPNVESTGGPRRISEKPMIRGLSGRRVLVTIDGTRQNFESAHKGAVFLEPELLKQVDIVRGPASALYGSDAIGGVIAATTKDPVDFLRPDQEHGFRVKLGYQDANQEQLLSGSAYGYVNEELDYLLHVTHRAADDIRQGGGKTLANSGDEIQGGLFKLMWTPRLEHTLRLSLETHDQRQETPINTQIDDPGNLSVADRTTERQTIRLSHHYESFASDRWNLRTVYYRTATELLERRQLDQRQDKILLVTDGFEVQNQSLWELGPTKHLLTYGLDWFQDTQTSARNGDDLKTFPSATVQVSGLFLQDEVTWQERWEWIPGLRYDRFETKAQSVGSSRSQEQFSPKLTVAYRFQPWLRSYVSYGQGFRVPSVQELYISGVHFGGNPQGIFVPNPDLKPETSTNQELGLQIERDHFGAPRTRARLAVAYFRNQLNDFIDSTTYYVSDGETASGLVCRNQGGCLYFENRNVQRGVITGVEAELFLQRQHFAGELSYSQTRGRNETTGEELASMPADKWVLQLRGALPERDLSWNWKTQLVAAQDRVPADSGVEKTPGYAIHDASGTWKPRFTGLDGLRLDFGVENLADLRYRKHLSQLDEAGRNLKASLTYQY